jgi:beta-lactamase class D
MSKILLLSLFTSLSFISAFNIFDKERAIVEEWEGIFENGGVDGTFLLYKLNSDTLFVHNSSRAAIPFLPASTFKILNSLIVLETNVIADESEIIKWDGNKRFFNKWNQDHNLRSAIKYSCVWFYQELARRVGTGRMQSYLDAADYGNKTMGGRIDTFWLEGDLRISAFEQIHFLEKFVQNKLPFSMKNLSIVKDILLVDSTGNSKLYAKTGLTARAENRIGWYVGFTENENDVWIFAMNIDIESTKDWDLRRGITERILKGEGIL